MKHLFTYGTLMCEDIMEDVSGCRLPFEPGVLNGYSRKSVRGEDYPGIIPHDGGSVAGLLYRNVPDPAWERLDRFEDVMYARHSVPILLKNGETVTAQAYVVQPEYRKLLEPSEWDFEAFLRSGKARFQSHFKGYRSL